MIDWPTDKRKTIHPGEYHVAKGELMISTLLGSCVAACLYDPVMKVIGMNHFLLANKRYSKDMPVVASEAGRYGIYAMELLINSMLKAGAQKRNIKAKVFGGGNVLPGINGTPSFFAIGDVNGRFVQEFLAMEKIPILASGLGGTYGRVVHFTSGDYSVYVKRITQSRTLQLEKREQQYWEKAVKEQEKEQDTSIQFW